MQNCQETGQQAPVTRKNHRKNPCLDIPRDSCPLASDGGRRKGGTPPTRAQSSLQKNVDFQNPMGLGGLPQDGRESKSLGVRMQYGTECSRAFWSLQSLCSEGRLSRLGSWPCHL